jgi:hypothetical protein
MYNTCRRNEHTYAQVCLQLYIYLYLWFLNISKFWNPLLFVKICFYMRFTAHSVTKIMFHSSVLLFFVPLHLQMYKSTHHLICHFHNKYTTYVQSVHLKCWNTSFYYITCTSSLHHKPNSSPHICRWSRSYFTTDSQSVSQYVLVSSTLVGLVTRYYIVGMLLSEICGLVSIWRPLWQEDGSAICNVITQ